MRRLALMGSIGATLVLGACGGGNDNASTTTVTTPTTSTQPTNGKTQNSGNNNKKSGNSNGSGGGSSSSGGGNTKTNTQAQTSTQAQTQTSTTPTPAAVSPYKTAKNVCGNILPTVVKRQLKSGKTTKKKVAKSYSKGWPSDQRNQAYKGCLAGLQ